MKLARVLFLPALLFALLPVSALYAQDAWTGVTVDLPHETIVAGTTLPPGEYDIRRDTTFETPVLTIFNVDQLQHEAQVMSWRAERRQPAEHSRVVLERVGNEYYLTGVWLRGSETGYTIPLPEGVAAHTQETPARVTG